MKKIKLYTEMSEFLANLSTIKRFALIKSTFEAESATNLLNSMLNPDAALSNLSSILEKYTNNASGLSELGSSISKLV